MMLRDAMQILEALVVAQAQLCLRAQHWVLYPHDLSLHKEKNDNASQPS